MGVFENFINKHFSKETLEMRSYELKDGGKIETEGKEEMKEGVSVKVNGEVKTGEYELKSGKKVSLKEGGIVEKIEDPVDEITSMSSLIEENASQIKHFKIAMESLKAENEKLKEEIGKDTEVVLNLMKEDYEAKVLEMSAKVEKIQEAAREIKQDINIEEDVEGAKEAEMKVMTISDVKKLKQKQK